MNIFREVASVLYCISIGRLICAFRFHDYELIESDCALHSNKNYKVYFRRCRRCEKVDWESLTKLED